MLTRRNLMTILAVLLVLSLALSACAQQQGTQAEAQQALTLTDGAGDEVALEGTAEKLIVFAPSVLEVLDALDAMDMVAGVDSWSIDSGEPLAQGFEAYGDYSGPNIERIAEASPDAVIRLSGSAEEDYDQLRDLGISVYTFEAQSFERAYQEIVNIGQMIGKQDQAQALKDEFEAGVQDIYQQVKDLDQDQKPLAFYQIFDDPLWSAGTNTYIDDMIEKAGGINIVAMDGIDGYAEYSVEKLLENNPQVMIAGDAGMYDIDSTEIITGDARFASVDAVVHDRVYIVPENFVVRPNHLSVKGLMMMAQAFHPDLFGEFEAIQ